MCKTWFLLIMVSLFVTGCNVQKNSDVTEGEPKTPSVAEASSGDFHYRLTAESDEFEAGGPIRMYAELEYTGEGKSIDIYHAASPFYFHIHEKTRNFEIPYAMNEPLIMTTLVKGEPLREDYRRSGGYSEKDAKAYQEFTKQVMDGKFPEGFYEVDGSAAFYTGNPEKDMTDYDIHATIRFSVVE